MLDPVYGTSLFFGILIGTAVFFFVQQKVWHYNNRGTFKPDPPEDSYWRHKETEQIIKVGCNAVTLWYGHFPANTYKDEAALFKMTYEEFHKNYVKVPEEEMESEIGLQLLAKL